MRKAIYSLILITHGCVWCASSATSQPSTSDHQAEVDDVRLVIDALFDGMRSGDSSAVRAVLHPDARFMTTLIRNGTPILHEGGVDGFVEAVGAPHEQMWDERIRNVTIQVDGLLAAGWMDYAFFLGDGFSHCGVNAMQFFKAADGWKVIQITDTRRSQGCDLPDDL